MIDESKWVKDEKRDKRIHKTRGFECTVAPSWTRGSIDYYFFSIDSAPPLRLSAMGRAATEEEAIRFAERVLAKLLELV